MHRASPMPLTLLRRARPRRRIFGSSCARTTTARTTRTTLLRRARTSTAAASTAGALSFELLASAPRRLLGLGFLFQLAGRELLVCSASVTGGVRGPSIGLGLLFRLLRGGGFRRGIGGLRLRGLLLRLCLCLRLGLGLGLGFRGGLRRGRRRRALGRGMCRLDGVRHGGLHGMKEGGGKGRGELSRRSKRE